jgi:hypothetical protein
MGVSSCSGKTSVSVVRQLEQKTSRLTLTSQTLTMVLFKTIDDCFRRPMNEYFCLCQGVDHETGVVEEELIGKIWLVWWFTYVFDPPNNRYLPNAVRRLSKR